MCIYRSLQSEPVPDAVAMPVQTEPVHVKVATRLFYTRGLGVGMGRVDEWPC